MTNKACNGGMEVSATVVTAECWDGKNIWMAKEEKQNMYVVVEEERVERELVLSPMVKSQPTPKLNRHNKLVIVMP